MLILPLRAGERGLRLDYSLNEMTRRHVDANRALEEAWAGLLTVVCESWPDWPLEVWTRLREDEPDPETGDPVWTLCFCLFFAGDGPDNQDVAAMCDFATRGLQGVLLLTPTITWGGIDPDWKPLWAVDDGEVYRLIVPERTMSHAVYLLGTYAGLPAWFAATLEAWPLQGSGLPIKLAEADMGWTF